MVRFDAVEPAVSLGERKFLDATTIGRLQAVNMVRVLELRDAALGLGRTKVLGRWTLAENETVLKIQWLEGGEVNLMRFQRGTWEVKLLASIA